MLLLVGASTTVLTYFLMGFVPPEFKSEAIISTGIIERRAIELERENPFRQQFQVSSQFSNFVTRLQSRTSIRQLSHRLLSHDLNALLANEKAFNTPDKEEWTYTAKEAKQLLKLLQSEAIAKPSKETEPRLQKVTAAFGYDFKTLSEQTNVYRDGSTDYLKIIFTGNSAAFAAYAVNAIAENFTQNYNSDRIAQEQLSVRFYTNLATDKKQEVDSLSALIASYKRNQKIIDLEELGSSLIAERKDLEMAREEERKNIEGLKKAVSTLDGYLKAEEFEFDSTAIASLLLREKVGERKEKEGNLLNEYDLQTPQNESLAVEFRSRGVVLNDQIKELVRERIRKEERLRKSKEVEDLFVRRIEAEIDLLLAEESVKSLNQALGQVEKRTLGFVTDETQLERLEGEKTIRTEEYLDIVSKKNEAGRIALSSAMPLSIIEYGEVPEKAEGSKAKIIAVLGGIVATGGVAVLLIFLALFNNFWIKKQEGNENIV